MYWQFLCYLLYLWKNSTSSSLPKSAWSLLERPLSCTKILKWPPDWGQDSHRQKKYSYTDLTLCLPVSFKDSVHYNNGTPTLRTEVLTWFFLSLRKDIFTFFFSKASLSTTTWPSHWRLVFTLFFLLHCRTASELSEELLSFNYLIFPVVLLGKPQDVVAHLTDLSEWLMSLVSQILHLYYRILTIERRLQNLEHLQTQKRIRLD